MVSGVQNAKLFSGDQDLGLALMQWKDSARGVGQNMVTRRGGAVGVMVGKAWEGLEDRLTWGSGCWPELYGKRRPPSEVWA